jgi:NAD(P)-dependent dehydrogenase (short-subunit alcohol dehydrogenase family)
LLDVTNAQDCRRVIEREKPFALVNNAGTSFTGAVEDVDDATARLALETMAIAPIRLARLALPHMREAGEGRIVNISSIYGRTSTPLTGGIRPPSRLSKGLPTRCGWRSRPMGST